MGELITAETVAVCAADKVVFVCAWQATQTPDRISMEQKVTGKDFIASA
jgi:hypothetical protein